MKKATLGGIIKLHSTNKDATDICGFKIGFKTKEEANKYKEMFKWILESDKYKVVCKKGYYDGD